MLDEPNHTPYRYVGIREDKAGERLAPFLNIHPPDDHPGIDRAALAKAPPMLSFQRKREIELPWRTIFEHISTGSPPSLAGVRRAFESGWPLPDSPKDADYALLAESGWLCQIKADPGKDAFAIAPVYQARFDDKDGSAKAVAVTEGVVFRHASGRLYLVIGAAPLTIDIFKTRKGYEQAWASGIDNMELVFADAKDATAFFTGFSEIDLRPAVIQRKFIELMEERDLANKVGAHVAELTESMVKRIVATRFETGEIDDAQNRLIQIRVNRFDIERRIDRLVGQAAGLGYYLFKEGGAFEFPDKKKTTVQPGQIYTKYQRTASWTTRHARTETWRTRVWFWTEKRSRTVNETRQHAQIVADFKPVDTSVDLLGQCADAYRCKGMQPQICARGGEGFITQDGQSLRAIMQRCEADEAFRRRCVVFLPVYEERLTGERALIKYSIFERPLPGLLATDLPRLSVVEQLSYRTAWRGMQLGELISSINLAPGETRTVVVSKEFRKESTVGRSSTSIFEINESESTDLATEMENQVSNERQSDAYVDSDASVKGSYGGFVTAEASVRAGASESMRQASQAISRIAKKAAHAINRQQREEVTSTSSTRTTVATRDQTTATLRNINEGRSLNLMFYRVYNRYDSALFLENLRLEVIPGVEVIAGSGVYASTAAPLYAMDQLLEALDEAQLPFALTEADVYVYRKQIIDSIETLLDDEYGADENKHDSRSIGLLQLQAPRGWRAQEMDKTTTSEIADLEQRLKHMKDEEARRQAAKIECQKTLAAAKKRFAQPTILSEQPRGEQALLIASGGLYLDSLVGVQPSTEPFSEAMREQEVRMRAAEVFTRESDGIFQRAQASRLGRLRPAGDGNWLVGLMPSRDLTRLTLSTRAPLDGGEWRLLLDGEALENTKLDVRESEIVAVFDAPQNWLMEPNLGRRIGILDGATGGHLSML